MVVSTSCACCWVVPRLYLNVEVQTASLGAELACASIPRKVTRLSSSSGIGKVVQVEWGWVRPKSVPPRMDVLMFTAAGMSQCRISSCLETRNSLHKSFTGSNICTCLTCHHGAYLLYHMLCFYAMHMAGCVADRHCRKSLIPCPPCGLECDATVHFLAA